MMRREKADLPAVQERNAALGYWLKLEIKGEKKVGRLEKQNQAWYPAGVH